MAEFGEVMRQWKRMCDTYTKDDADCCSDCPVGDLHEHGCGAIFEMENVTDWDQYANAIMAWAAEHPAPIYPTWGDWFAERGDLIKLWRCIRVCSSHGQGVIGFLYDHIPADIAQKLDIKPLPIVNGDCGSTNREDAINNLGIKLKEHQ